MHVFSKESGMTRKKDTGKRQDRPSSCVACGAAAAGYNYDAPSCYSCKSFFRRAIVTKRVYLTCLKNGRCSSNASIRQCRACRFGKCVSGGMNPLLVGIPNPELNPVVQRMRYMSAEQNEEPSASNSSVGSFSLPGMSDTPCSSNNSGKPDELRSPQYEQKELELKLFLNPQQMECKLEKLMRYLVNLDDAHHRLRVSTYSPRVFPGTRIDDFLDGRSKLGGNFEPMPVEAYEPISINAFPEEVYIQEGKVMDIGHGFDYTRKKLWTIQDLVYAIEFMKALPVYHLLSDCSKKVFIASTISCSNFTTAYYSYSNNSDRTCYPDGGIVAWSKELLDQAQTSIQFYTGIISAMREANLDKREYALLKMILICNPILNGLSAEDAALLQQEKERCTKTLFSYVFARRGVKDGPAHLLKLLSILDVTNTLNARQKNLHLLILAMGLHKYKCEFAESIFHSS